jgi:hypothetical protein
VTAARFDRDFEGSLRDSVVLGISTMISRNMRKWAIPNPYNKRHLTEVVGLHTDLEESIGRGDEGSAAACSNAMTGYAVEFTRRIVLE